MKLRMFGLAIAAFFTCGLLLLQVLAPVPTSTIWITGGVYPQAGVFTIWREGNHFYAKDQYGHLAFDDADCYHVFTNITNAMPTEGGVITFAINQASKGAIFNFSRGIVLPTKVSLVGQGKDRVPRLSFMQGDSSDCITVLNATGGSYSRLENLRVTGHAGTTGNGIVTTDGTHTVILRNVESDNHGGHGFFVNGSYKVDFFTCSAENNAGDGYHISTLSTTVGEIYLHACYAKDNAGDGIEISTHSTSNIVLNGGSYETNGRHGGFFRGGPISLYGVKFENNLRNSCLWAAQGTIAGCYFQYAPTGWSGFNSTSGGATTLTTNRFGGNADGDITLGSTANTFTILPQYTALGVGVPLNYSINALSYDHQIYGWNNFTAVTNATGYWNQTFTWAFTEKPHVELTLEANYAYYVHTWYTDANGRYIAALIRVTDLAGGGINLATVRMRVSRFGG